MDVKIYVSPTCTWCQKLKEWMKKKKIPYQELDLEESDTYRDEVIEKSGQLAVPVIDIDGQIIVGFQEEQLEKALAKAKKL